MKKVFTFFAALAMLASVSFAQKDMDANRVLKSTRFAPAKLTKNNDAKNGRKVTGNPIWENTMSYCLDDPFYNRVGTQALGDTVYWAISIESAALTGRNNLTNVEFFIVEAGTYNLSIYSGAQPTGTALYTQTINATDADTMAWKTITFATPIAINQTQDLWVVLSNSDVDYPAAGVAGNEYDNGKWVSLDGIQWMNVADAGVDVTWMIRATSDTYTVLPPYLSLEGPTAVRTGDTATFLANSPNGDTFEWSINADYLDVTSIENVAFVVWETAGTQQVIVTATNTAGSTTDTLNVDVFSCNDITLPYTPNFNGGLGCWDTRSDSTEGSGWFASVDMFESDPEGQVLSISAQNYLGFIMIDFPVDNWLISPEIEMPSTGEYEIAWQVKPITPDYTGDHYGVYVINDGDTTLLFEESLTGMTDYNQRMAVIPSTISGDFQVAFRHFNCEGGYVIILDSIQIRALTAPQVTLAGPVAVEVGNVATYTATAPNATNFEWSIDGLAIAQDSNVLTISLDLAGFHTIQVVATNNEGSDTAILSVEAYTCTAISEFPYMQDFENGIRCWNMVSMDSINDDRFGVYEDEDAFAGNYDFRFSSYSRAADYNQYLISPELTLPQGEFMVKFQYVAYSYTDSFRVLASSTTNDVSAFTTVLADYPNTAQSWTEVCIPVPAGTKYIAFNYYGNYQYYLYIDDITIKIIDIVPTVTIDGPVSAEVDEEVTFTAAAPLATSFAWTVDGVDANTTGNTLTTSFTTAGNHTVQVVATNSIGNSTPATATINIFSCDAITTFPWIADFEEADIYGCWKFIDADGDGFNWNTDYLRDATGEDGNYMGHNNSTGLVGSASWNQSTGALTPDNWMILPAMALPADAQLYLSWYEKGQDPEYAEEHYSVYISTTGNNVNDFTTASGNFVATGEWVGHNINLGQYAGQTIYIAFRHHDCTDMFYLDIDDIMISTDAVVGIDNVENSILSLYPNPASAMVTVSAEGIEGNVTVQVVDLNGRVMLQQQGTAQSYRFDVSTLAQGAYFVRLSGENVNATRKLIVK